MRDPNMWVHRMNQYLSEVVHSPDGSEYLVRVIRNRRVGLFMATPERWANTFRRNPGWSLIVEAPNSFSPLLRQRFPTVEAAYDRANVLVSQIEDGTWPTRDEQLADSEIERRQRWS